MSATLLIVADFKPESIARPRHGVWLGDQQKSEAPPSPPVGDTDSAPTLLTARADRESAVEVASTVPQCIPQVIPDCRRLAPITTPCPRTAARAVTLRCPPKQHAISQTACRRWSMSGNCREAHTAGLPLPSSSAHSLRLRLCEVRLLAGRHVDLPGLSDGQVRR